MKKFIKILLVALTVAVMAVMFVGCSDKSGAIKRAFEGEGYTVTAVNGADNEQLKSWLSDEKLDEIGKYEVITCTKGLLSAVIFKCPSKDSIIDVLGQEAYDSATESGLVNGNCYMITLVPEAVEIFKYA